MGAWAQELTTVHFHSPSSGDVEEWARWNTLCALCLGGRKRKKKEDRPRGREKGRDRKEGRKKEREEMETEGKMSY